MADKKLFYFVIRVHWGTRSSWSGYNGYCIAEAIDEARDKIRNKYLYLDNEIDRIEFRTLKEITIDGNGIFI